MSTNEILNQLYMQDAYDQAILDDMAYEAEVEAYWNDGNKAEAEAVATGWLQVWQVYDDEGKLRSYDAWEREANGQVYEAVDAEHALQMNAVIAKDAIRQPLIDAGVLKPVKSAGCFVWDWHGNYENIDGAWFGSQTEWHILNVESGGPRDEF